MGWQVWEVRRVGLRPVACGSEVEAFTEGFPFRRFPLGGVEAFSRCRRAVPLWVGVVGQTGYGYPDGRWVMVRVTALGAEAG